MRTFGSQDLALSQPLMRTVRRYTLIEVRAMKLGSAFSCLALSHSMLGMLGAPLFASPLVLNPGMYEVTVETLLPHLEENLRYATTRERQCLGTQEATMLFPILRHEAFTGCSLTDGRSSGEQVEYSLICKNPGAATGTARLTLSPAVVHGVLEIKMGGKNITLSQRIHGQHLGVCQAVK